MIEQHFLLLNTEILKRFSTTQMLGYCRAKAAPAAEKKPQVGPKRGSNVSTHSLTATCRGERTFSRCVAYNCQDAMDQGDSL